MRTIELEASLSKSKAKSTKNFVKHTKILSANNTQYSNLKWEDIAGLSLNVLEDDSELF